MSRYLGVKKGEEAEIELGQEVAVRGGREKERQT